MEVGPNAVVVGVVDTAAGCIEVDFEQESYDYSDDAVVVVGGDVAVVVVVAAVVVVVAAVVVVGTVGLAVGLGVGLGTRSILRNLHQMTNHQHWELALEAHIDLAYQNVLLHAVPHNQKDPFYPFHGLILRHHPLVDEVHDDCCLEVQLNLNKKIKITTL